MELMRDAADDINEYGGTLLPRVSGEAIDEALDRLPELCTYRDEGCEFAISCLNCPFPDCILEQPGGRHFRLKKIRDREIASMYYSGGKRTKELAQRFGVSLRTVQRIVRRAKSG